MALQFMDEFVRMLAQLRGQNPDIAEANANMAGVSTPYREEDQAIQEDLNRIRNRETEFTPDFGTRMRAIGSTFRSLGSGGRVPNENAQIMAEGERAAREQYKLQVQREQEEQALRYIAKTGNPELLAAFRAGMDPGQIIKLKFDQEQAEKERGWAKEDAATQHGYRLNEQEVNQENQLKYSPELAKQRETLAAQAAWRKQFGFGEDPNAPPVPADTGPVSAPYEATPEPATSIVTPPPQPNMPTSEDPEGIQTGGFNLFPQQEESLPTVSPMTVKAREYFRDPELNDAETMMLIRAGSDEEANKIHEGIMDRRLRLKELNKFRELPENTTVWDPVTQETVFTAPDVPEPLPADVRTVEYLMQPGKEKLFEAYKEIKLRGAGTVDPGQKAFYDHYVPQLFKTYGKLTDQANEVAYSEPDMQAMEALVEVAPQGALDPNALISTYVSSWSDTGDTLDALVQRQIPRQRVADSGSTSDLEHRSMARSLPSLLKTKEGNKAIIAIMRRRNEIKAKMGAAVAAYAVHKDITRVEKELAALRKESITKDLPKEVRDIIKSAMNEARGEVANLPDPEAADDIADKYDTEE